MSRTRDFSCGMNRHISEIKREVYIRKRGEVSGKGLSLSYLSK